MIKKTAIAAVVSAIAMPALALEPMPKEPGFSGFVNLGAGTGSVESNFLARVAGIDVDLGDDTIQDFGSPASFTSFSSSFTFFYFFYFFFYFFYFFFYFFYFVCFFFYLFYFFF